MEKTMKSTYSLFIAFIFSLSNIGFAQNNQDIEQQLKWLTDSKGWVVESVYKFYVTDKNPENEFVEWSSCVQSAILILQTNGKYRENHPKKDCPEQRITDNTGTFKYYSNPKLGPGIIYFTLQDAKISHYWRFYDVILLTEEKMILTYNVDNQSEGQNIITFKKNK